MPRIIECSCNHCVGLHHLLRRVSPDLAKKHARKYGLSQPAPPLPHVQPNSAPNEGDFDFDMDFGGMDHGQGGSGELGEGRDGMIGMGQNDRNGCDGNEQPPQGEREHLRQQQDPPQRVFHDTEFHKIHIPEGPELNIDDDSASGIPPTFRLGEPASVRMAYLQAVYNNVANHMPVCATTQSLNMTLDIIEATGTLPDVPAPARTLATAKRRLGIDPDALIIQYAICPKCWKHHTPEQMGALESPKCATLNCSGEIYEEFQDSGGNTKRRAIKILPQVSLIHSLRRLVRRKGFRKLLLKTDTNENRNDDDTFVMTDMHDGSIWHELKTGIQREVGNLGSVRDMPITEGSERKVTENAFGLILSVNLDWYVWFLWIYFSF